MCKGHQHHPGYGVEVAVALVWANRLIFHQGAPGEILGRFIFFFIFGKFNVTQQYALCAISSGG
jgi:hypothetical protein